MKNYENKKGITLIALVITIIVLLILAGVTLGTLFGENGIITRAEDATIEYRVGEIKDFIALIKSEYAVSNPNSVEPTSRYVITQLITDGRIVEDEVEDYGDTTGRGIINIEGRLIYVDSNNVTDVDIPYDVVDNSDYSTIRLYPQIEGSNTYGDYAINILMEKTSQEEREVLFTEGNNYWNIIEEWGEPNYNNFEELIDYWNENYKDGVLTGFQNLGIVYGYSNTTQMMIDWSYVEPEKYNDNVYDENNYIIKNFTLTTPDGNIQYLDTEVPYFEYTVTKSGKYEFTVESDGVIKKQAVYVSMKKDNSSSIFKTDGEGTIIGLQDWCLSGIGDSHYDCTTCSIFNIITVPEEIDGEKITKIGYRAFAFIAGIEEIILPDTIEHIEDEAFSTCISLEKINLPEGIETIGYYIFNSCVSLENLTIPNSVTSIGECAFRYCENLQSLFLPENVTNIGENAFIGCYSLESVNIPSKVTVIENYTFNDCISLKDLELHDNITSIGEYAFDNCRSLTELKIPLNVTSIGSYAFSSCTSLSKIILKTGTTLTVPSNKWGATNATVEYE